MPTDPLEQLVEKLLRWPEITSLSSMAKSLMAQAASLLTSQAQELAEVKADRNDLQQTFDLQWKADMRGVEMWRQGRPDRALTLPDHGHLVSWLLGELEDVRRSRITMDCRYTMGRVADFSGSHCPPGDPCQRCRLEAAEAKGGGTKP